MAHAREAATVLRRGARVASVLALRLGFAPEWRASFPELTLDQALGTRFAALAKSGSAFLPWFPAIAAFVTPSPVTSLASVEAVAGVALLAAVALLSWQRRGPTLLFALALLPSLQLVPIMRWWSPHYLYVPLAFGSLGLASSLESMPKWGRTVAPVVIVGLALLAFQTSGFFATDRTLFEREVAFRPECREAEFYLGEAARSERRWDEAARHYERALANDPKVLSFVDLGGDPREPGRGPARATARPGSALGFPLGPRTLERSARAAAPRAQSSARCAELGRRRRGRSDSWKESPDASTHSRKRCSSGRERSRRSGAAPRSGALTRATLRGERAISRSHVACGAVM